MYCIVVYCRVCTVLYCKKSLIAQSNKWIIYIHTIHLVISKLNRVWLVVDLPPLKNMSSSVWVILPNWMETKSSKPPTSMCIYIYIHSAIHHGIFYFDEQWRGFSRFYQPAPALNADTMISEGQMQGLTNDQPNKPNNQPISINEAIVNQSSRINQPITKKFPVNHPQSARFWGPWFCEKTKRGWYIAWHP